jgi:hypothetical protein
MDGSYAVCQKPDSDIIQHEGDFEKIVYVKRLKIFEMVKSIG